MANQSKVNPVSLPRLAPRAFVNMANVYSIACVPPKTAKGFSETAEPSLTHVAVFMCSGFCTGCQNWMRDVTLRRYGKNGFTPLIWVVCNSLSKQRLDMEEGRNRSPQASFLYRKCLILPMSQALHHHYLTQHFLNTFADVFADSCRVFCRVSERIGINESPQFGHSSIPICVKRPRSIL